MKVTDFDRIVCITLDTRFPAWPLRARREVEAKGAGCSLFLNGRDRVEELGRARYDQVNGDVPPGFNAPAGAYHLLAAFREVVRRADRDGIETLLIVEDDLEFTPEYDAVTGAIRVPGDWGLYYFGANHAWSPTEEAGPNLLRVHGSYTTHCVGVHRRAFAAILALDPARPIDVLLGSVHGALPCYAAWPSVAIQVPGPSTIHGGHADYAAWFRSKGSNWMASPPNPDDGPPAPRAAPGPAPARAGIDPAVRDAVLACEHRGPEGGLVLLDGEKSGCCGGGAERTECRAGKGKRPGRVTLRECLACKQSA